MAAQMKSTSSTSQTLRQRMAIGAQAGDDPVFSLGFDTGGPRAAPMPEAMRPRANRPLVPPAVLAKLLAYSVAMFAAPLTVYFVGLERYFNNNTTLAGIAAAVTANVVLVLFVVDAMREDDADAPADGAKDPVHAVAATVATASRAMTHDVPEQLHDAVDKAVDATVDAAAALLRPVARAKDQAVDTLKAVDREVAEADVSPDETSSTSSDETSSGTSSAGDSADETDALPDAALSRGATPASAAGVRQRRRARK
ncbi:hypothetical protein CXG81DRAFT_19120 [Caulochytrium protostelioides]|uniref:Uncharacterized protein n=1 Tax=Caulochytrium protostelioides TaxID=1555241 RepID=A0A4P9X744_9FUNG|nr:hypothetical protein CXG81DRAFT_19120 [Caulochytrium protostelioides]|eukprot:RKP01022.1 hypothetical protein CXG81DRAFT_19120 [Caulochytrium protostelioides]